MVLPLLRDLVAAKSPSKEEGPAVDVMTAWLGDCVRADRNVAAVREAGQGPTLLLLSHLDTVPATAAWSRDPWAPTIEDGRMYGLGANDAKGCVAAMAVAFRRARIARGRLVFAAVCEEEIGRGGAEVFLPTLPPADEAIVGEPTGLQIATSQLGMLLLECEAKGRAGHAARPHLAENAIYAAARDILAVEALSIALGGVGAVTVVNGGDRHNVIPDRCRYTIDFRSEVPHDVLIERVRAAVGAEVTVRSDRFRPVATPSDARVLAAARATGATAFASPTLSDWVHLTCPAIKWGPGLSEVSHTADEWVEVAMVERAVEDYTRVIEQVLG